VLLIIFITRYFTALTRCKKCYWFICDAASHGLSSRQHRFDSCGVLLYSYKSYLVLNHSSKKTFVLSSSNLRVKLSASNNEPWILKN